MKIRNDFVSNSSSSSFVVLLSENKYNIALDDPNILSLKQYLEYYAMRELFDYNFEYVSLFGLQLEGSTDTKKIIKFIPNDEYYNIWKSGKSVYLILPECFEKIFKSKPANCKLLSDIKNYYIEKIKQLNNKSIFSIPYDYSQSLEYAIIDSLYEFLKSQSNEEIFFASQSYSDSYIDGPINYITTIIESSNYNQHYSLSVLAYEDMINGKLEMLKKAKLISFFKRFSQH